MAMSPAIAFFPFIVVLAIMLTGIIAVTVVVITIIRAIAGRREVNNLNQEDELQFRQLMAALQKMEERIANLETILMQRERSAGYRPSDEERR